jgi:hypothetical protein
MAAAGACSPSPSVVAPTVLLGSAPVAVAPSRESEPTPSPKTPTVKPRWLPPIEPLPPDAPLLPALALGSCVWGPPPSVPPLTLLAQATCGAAAQASFTKPWHLKSRVDGIAGHLRRFESLVARAEQDPRLDPGPGMEILAMGYADLECLEAELCASATAPGSPEDRIAATAARRRMKQMCARLHRLQYQWQCP